MDETKLLERARSAALRFALYGDCRGLEPYGSGHINRTFLLTMDQAGRPVRYILQLLNTFAFREPLALMDNIVRVTEHLRRRMAAEGLGELSRRSLTVLPALAGGNHHIDAEGGFWRCYLFIEGASASDLMDSPAKAYVLGEAAGRFQYLLADLPAPRLAETIPGFHDTRRRWAAFERAVAADPAGRARLVAPEIDFFASHRPVFDRIVEALDSGAIPERIAHNDTKISNLLLDDGTGEAICVIDLDTVMPGSSTYDFGDLARTVAASAPEDESEPARMRFVMPMYEALARGFAAGTRGCLTAAERELLPDSARILTMLMGVRFLTDHLEGDIYYHVARAGHNLDRSRTQIALIASMEGQWDGIVAATKAAFG